MTASLGPRTHQPRERSVPCQGCGLDDRRRPRRMTWNVSAFCDECEARWARRYAVDALVEQGYGPQVAEHIVDRMTEAQRAVAVNDVLPAQRGGT